LHDQNVDAEQRYRLLVDSITDYAIYMLDPNGIVVSWNAGAERFKGYLEDEIIGQHFSTFYLPEDRERGLPAKTLGSARKQGRFEGEGWRMRKDGSPFWAHVVVDPIKGTDGELIGFAKITRDLSERKAAEDRLRKTEQQFRLLVQGVTDYAIYMMDENGYVSSWNAGAERIKGYSADEIVGQHFSRFFQDEDLETGLPKRALETARREGRFESEGWRLRKDGTRFWANAVVDAIRDDDGKLIGFAKITRDITEKRETQKALEEAREELFQAQKMEAIGQLTGGVAHDFNNLLMVIQGSLELLGKRLSHTPATAKLVNNALQAAKRGASLTQRMLAFSRRQELELAAVDVHDVIGSTTDILQRALGPSVFVDTQLSPHLPKVITDPHQLASALLNLAINARDAMPSGGTITIRAKLADRAGKNNLGLRGDQYICLSVEDTGEGMDEDTLAKATAPFFTTKGVGKGTGLGLAMVEGLMAQSKGKLVLRSQKGKGTTAELWLPVTADGARQMAARPKPPISENNRALMVLAVDDDPLVLMNTVMMLEDMGHTVKDANSAAEALEILRGSAAQLVVTDHAMPGMTGAQLAEVVREEWPDVPVILATGYAELPVGDNREVIRLSKPFTEEQLKEAVALATSAKMGLKQLPEQFSLLG
jgi:PAS domain S-box-containing protein